LDARNARKGLKFKVPGSKFKVQGDLPGAEFKVPCSRFQVSASGAIQGSKSLPVRGRRRRYFCYFMEYHKRGQLCPWLICSCL